MTKTICMGIIMAAEAVIAWIYCERLFDRRRKLWALTLAYVLAYAALFGITFSGNTTINSISFVLINCFLIRYCYPVRSGMAMLHSAFLCFVVLASEVLVSLVINLFGYDFTEYTHNLSILLTLGIWSKLLYLVLAVFCARLFSRHKYDQEEPRFLALFCVLPIFSAAVGAVIIYIAMASEVNQAAGVMMIINIASLLVVNLLFFSMYHHFQNMHAQQLQIQLRMQKEENEALYYQALQEQSDSQRILIHDFKNHMHTLKQLAEQGETEAISEYLSKMDDTIGSIPKSKLCNEPVLNILLLRFTESCKERGVKFSCDVRESCLTFMDPVSMTSLFGNLLSNALEAAAVSTAKEIDLSVRYSTLHYSVIISITNSCDIAPTSDGAGSYVTSKKDRRQHGVGLKSIERIVEKYHGLDAAQYNEKRHVFFHFIHIPYDPEKK